MPVGPLRWRMPEPLLRWSGVRDATCFGPTWPHAPTQIEAPLGGTLGEQSEDCLYLDIWTPGCNDAKRPVMMWIHGGAFVIGAGSHGLYNGSHLAGARLRYHRHQPLLDDVYGVARIRSRNSQHDVFWERTTAHG